MESSSLQELEQIPGVGKNIARDMHNIGIHSIDDLKGQQATRDTSHQRRATLKLLTCSQKLPTQRLNWQQKVFYIIILGQKCL